MPTNFAHNEQLLAESLPQGILVLSFQGQVLWCNEKAKQLLGLSNVTSALKITQAIPQPELQKLLDEQRFGSFQCPAPNNPDLFYSFQLSQYGEKQLLLIVQDVTHTHRLEAMRQDFIANVSHELRTPLTVFHGFLELVLAKPDIAAAKLKEILLQMDEQCRRMETLVQDLLWLAKLESDEPDLQQHQRVPVASLLRQICEDAKSLGGDKQHVFHVELDESLQLEGNAEELRSAFSNLIYNAVHYTPAHGRIEVYWYVDASGKHMVVKDTGIGIPKKYISRITQRFYRVDKARSPRRKGGTGLGLAIVKHVLLRHKGELHIESEVDVGSQFTCTFANAHI